MFDEADYDSSKDQAYPSIREKRKEKTLPDFIEEDNPLDGLTCHYKNVLKNGIAVGACLVMFAVVLYSYGGRKVEYKPVPTEEQPKV